MTKEEAQAKLDEACKVLEASFVVYPVIGDNAISATGEEYAEVFTPLADTPEEAVAAWKDVAISGYAYDRKGTIYWRIRPEIDVGSRDTTFEGQWKVYSRFLISDKPVIRAARRGLQG